MTIWEQEWSAEAAVEETAVAEAAAMAAIGNVLDKVGVVAGAIVAMDNYLGAEVDAVATPPLAPGTTMMWPLRPRQQRPATPPMRWPWWWIRK